MASATARDPLNSTSTFLQRTESKAVFRAMVWLFAAVVVIYSGIAIANALIPGKSVKDNGTWYDTGQHVLHGEAIYPVRKKFKYLYPPPAAIFLAPVSALGQTGVVIFLVLGNAVAWLLCIILSVRLATGSWRRAHPLVYILPNIFVSVYVWSNFHLGQPSLLLLMLMLGAFVGLQTKREISAGALIALAAGIKAFPFIAIVYLIYRRYWIAAASLMVTLTFLLIVMPIPIRGLQQAQSDLRRWTDGMLLKYDEKGVAQRPGRSNSWKNQSVFGITSRMFRHVDVSDDKNIHEPVYANIADLSFNAVNAIILASALILGLAYIAVMPRRKARTTESDALEFSLLLILILIFTPLSYGYGFAWLLLPFTVAVWRFLRQPNRSLGILTAVAVALFALSIPLQRPAQTYGNNFFASLLLFLALALELWRLKSALPKESRDPARGED